MGGEARLGEVAEIIMGQSPPGETYNEHGQGLPFFQGVTDFNYRYPTPRVFCSAPSRIAVPGDILLSVRAPIGRVNVADRKCAIGRGLSIIRPRTPEDARYLEFALRMKEPNWDAIEGSGSVFGNATRRDLEGLCLPWPEGANDRCAIAHILGTLDDKIELNRRMNKTLEEMARAIFKSWFVDFDPVHAKAAVRREHPAWSNAQVSRAALPNLKPEIAELFPDSFEPACRGGHDAGRDSDLGKIPKGWKVGCISDLAEVVGGSTPSTKDSAFWEDGIHCWATPKDLSSLTTPVLLNTERSITDAGLAQISSGLLPVGTVLLSSRAPIGYLAIAEIPVAINQGFIAMKPRNGVSNLFLLLWAHFSHEDIISRANGSTFLEISKTNFRPITLAVPEREYFEVFDTCVRPFYKKIVSNERETLSLVKLRDALLPKLISGELRIKEAEKLLKEKGL
jgi:type I restriction enzyme S subunit